MLISDIVARIPDEDLADIRENAKILSEVHPENDDGEKIDWFAVIVRDWWEKENTPPVGWFQWWED